MFNLHSICSPVFHMIFGSNLISFRYIYTDDVLLTAEVVLQVLYAAKKYEICILELRCSQFLKKNLCSNNAFTLLMQVSNSISTHM